MEIQFLHDNFTERDFRLLMEHIRRMASGEAQFFATTLSLVYDKLVGKALAQPFHSGFGLGKSAEVESPAGHFPPLQPSTSIPSIPSTFAFSYASSVSSFIPPTPAPNPRAIRPLPSSTATQSHLTWLRCHKRHQLARLAELHDGLRCPRCPSKNTKGPPLMQCTSCRTMRTARRDTCLKLKCAVKFR